MRKVTYGGAISLDGYLAGPGESIDWLRYSEETSALMYDWITQGKAPPPLTLTTGMLATRENVGEVREKMGLASK